MRSRGSCWEDFINRKTKIWKLTLGNSNERTWRFIKTAFLIWKLESNDITFEDWTSWVLKWGLSFEEGIINLLRRKVKTFRDEFKRKIRNWVWIYKNLREKQKILANAKRKWKWKVDSPKPTKLTIEAKSKTWIDCSKLLTK